MTYDAEHRRLDREHGLNIAYSAGWEWGAQNLVWDEVIIRHDDILFDTDLWKQARAGYKVGYNARITRSPEFLAFVEAGIA